MLLFDVGLLLRTCAATFVSYQDGMSSCNQQAGMLGYVVTAGLTAGNFESTDFAEMIVDVMSF